MKGGDKGQVETHTPAAAAPDRAIAQASALAGPSVADLLAGSPDIDADDVLALTAEPTLAKRRARGRPEGAANRKNEDFIRYLAAMGHRDPRVTLSLIQSADLTSLCALLGADSTKSRIAVLKLQIDAADRLMPYHHAKKPLELEVKTPAQRPVMIMGDMNVALVAAEGGFMSAGDAPEIIQQNQRMIDAETTDE